MKCPHCEKEINESDIVNYFASKGGKVGGKLAGKLGGKAGGKASGKAARARDRSLATPSSWLVRLAAGAEASVNAARTSPGAAKARL